MARIAFVILIVLESTVVIVALIAQPDKIYESEFLVTIVWLTFLIFLNWFLSSYILFKIKSQMNQRILGALPSLNIVVFIYSLASACLVSATWLIINFQIFEQAHLILQLILLAGMIILSMFILIASKAADIDVDVDTITTRELAKTLEMLIQEAPQEDIEFSNNLKKLLEHVRYSMPHTSKLSDSQNYRELCSRVMKYDAALYSNPNKESEAADLMSLARKC